MTQLNALPRSTTVEAAISPISENSIDHDHNCRLISSLRRSVLSFSASNAVPHSPLRFLQLSEEGHKLEGNEWKVE
jgi:hypothetical protein